MLSKRSLCTFVSALLLVTSVAFCDSLADDWNDFLHYTAIGRIDLAKGYGQKIIDSQPDPKELLKLSEENTKGYQILQRVYANSEELRDVAGKLIDIIEQGRYERRTDPKIILAEIERLSTTIRGRIAAEQRLKNAGEYAIPYMLDVLADQDRKDEIPYIIGALPKIGRDAIRPLVAALQTDNVAVKPEIIRALGQIGYGQSLGYLKYIVENDPDAGLKELAKQAIRSIDPAALQMPASELFFKTAEDYYYHKPSLAPQPGAFANVWFWDAQQATLKREQVGHEYFHELMSMRNCEWALKADENAGKAISLWLAAFFKSESTGLDQPVYFKQGHADAITYAMTAGPEYLHQTLDRALNDQNSYVALWTVEALASNAGQKSLLYRYGTAQPLVKALSYSDTSVRYSAAIAIASANPSLEFVGDKLIIENLAKAVVKDNAVEELGAELAEIYALRAVDVMLELAITKNQLIDLSQACDELVKVAQSDWETMQISAGQVLARLLSPDAQRAVCDMALSGDNSLEVRIEAFDSLAISAKQNGNQLSGDQIDGIYSIVSSDDADVDLRASAASAYGAFNLPSKKVKDLILDQAKS